MPVRGGAFCSPVGATGESANGASMVCNIRQPGERARWRADGKVPAQRKPRKRGGRTQPVAAPQAATGIALPVPLAYLDRPLQPNGWGYNGDLPVCYHDDGEIGRAVKGMGQDAQLDYDGEPLGDVLGKLATDNVQGRKSAQQVVDELKRIHGRLPEGSAARRHLGNALAELDHPMTEAPHVPVTAPTPLRQLTADLYAVPMVRRDPSKELEPLGELINDWEVGRVTPRMLISRVRDLQNRRHESKEGKFEIDRAVRSALEALERMRRTGSLRLVR